jgi:transcriptional regulator with XRE-family HTH domain
MIQNREQLLSMASMWVNEAKNDIRNQAIAFMNTMNVREEELAHVLGISRGELEQILRGNGEISLSTFAKILIATDNMIEIKPLSATPFGQETNFPHPQNVRSSHRQRPQRPMPRRIPFGGLMNASRPFGNMPITPSMRNAMDRGPQPMCSEQDMPLLLDSMSRSQLIDEIIKNGWGQEININSASRTQLIEFLAQKGRSVIEEISQQAAPYREPRMVEPNIEDVTLNEILPVEEDGPQEVELPPLDETMLNRDLDDDWLTDCENAYRGFDEATTPWGGEVVAPNEVVSNDTTEETITRLTQALRNNPQLVEALRNIIG